MRIGILAAMDKEFIRLRALLNEQSTARINHKDFVKGRLAHQEIILQQCGIGKVNAAIGAVELIDTYHPDLIISTGVAGGANPTLNVTEAVVSTACTYHDAYCGQECDKGQIMGMPTEYKTPAEFMQKAISLNCGVPVHAGLIVSGDWFVDSKDKMQTILNDFPTAMAVDMESCAIAQTCHIYHVPFVSFRVISDVPLKDTRAKQYFDFWDRLAEGSFNVTKAFLETL